MAAIHTIRKINPTDFSMSHRLDIKNGSAVVPFDESRNGWILPGRILETSQARAERVAQAIHNIISKAKLC